MQTEPNFAEAVAGIRRIPLGRIVIKRGAFAMCREEVRVVMVGPTDGLQPDDFLHRGVDVPAAKVVPVRKAMALASCAA